MRRTVLFLLSMVFTTWALSCGVASFASAQTREEVVLWETIKDSQRISDYLGYLDKYPDGTFSTIAKRRIEDMQKVKLEEMAGTSWSVRFDWSQKKKERSFTDTYIFSADGSCRFVAQQRPQACHWEKEGEAVTITLDADGDLCGRKWALTENQSTMMAAVSSFGAAGCSSAIPQTVTMTRLDSTPTQSAITPSAADITITGIAMANYEISGCRSLPGTNLTSFTTKDTSAWIYFTYTGGTAGGVGTIDWIKPDGSVYVTYNWTQSRKGGNYNYCYFVKIAGFPLEDIPGDWSVRLRFNGAEVARQAFVLSR